MDPRWCEKIVPVLRHFVKAQVRKLFELHSIYGWFGAQLAAAVLHICLSSALPWLQSEDCKQQLIK